ASPAEKKRKAIAAAPSVSQSLRFATSVGLDKRFRNAHRFRGRERLVDLRERVGGAADGSPGDGRVVPLEKAERADEMRDLTSPTAAHLNMLAVDLLVHVDGARAGISVMPRDHVPAAVSDEIQALLDRPSGACRLDRYIRARAACPIAD